MKTLGLLGMTIFMVVVQTCFGQEFGEDVENLTLTEVSPTISRLSWTDPKSLDCETAVTYSVFRGTREDFTPSMKNRIASRLTKMTYLAKEPVASKDYYYYVKASVMPAPCEHLSDARLRSRASPCVDEIANAIDATAVVLSESGRPIPIQIDAKNVSDETVAAEVIKALFPDWFTLTSSISAPKLSVSETTKEVDGQVIGSLQVHLLLPMIETFRFGKERHVVALWMGAAQESGLLYYGPNDYEYRRQVIHDVVYKVLSEFRDNITHETRLSR